MAQTQRQIHVTNGTRVQTLAVVEGTNGGVTLLSTCTGNGVGEVEIHIPASARDWLARMAREKRHIPIVPPIETMREEAGRALDAKA